MGIHFFFQKKILLPVYPVCLAKLAAIYRCGESHTFCNATVEPARGATCRIHLSVLFYLMLALELYRALTVYLKFLKMKVNLLSTYYSHI